MPLKKDLPRDVLDVVQAVEDRADKLVEALRLARRSQRVFHENLALSTVVIGVLVVAAVAGALSLPIAVLAHELSEFVVIGSGLRMLRA